MDAEHPETTAPRAGHRGSIRHRPAAVQHTETEHENRCSPDRCTWGDQACPVMVAARLAEVEPGELAEQFWAAQEPGMWAGLPQVTREQLTRAAAMWHDAWWAAARARVARGD